MRTQDLVFWLDVLRESTSTAGGVLCQRHGDSMVVPLGWTLDDLRDPELHLFRPPSPSDQVARRARRRAVAHPATEESEQLALLGGLVPPEHVDAESATHAPATVTSTSVVEIAPERTGDERLPAATGGAGPDPDDRWTPNFDDADDLDGLLSARSPLLSRAFRGTDRPD